MRSFRSLCLTLTPATYPATRSSGTIRYIPACCPLYCPIMTRHCSTPKPNIPPPNVFPDDPVNGATYWGTGTAYSVPAGTLTTNTTYWTFGDNRNQSLVQVVTDISLYHLHSRIAPVNIPELRAARYRAAIDLLKMASEGDITFDLTLLQPRQGARIRFGSNIKNSNSY